MADRTQANGRLPELERYSKRIAEQLQSFDQNVNIVTENIQIIQTALANDLQGDEAKAINDRFNRLREQYDAIKKIVTTQYTNLAEKISNYVTNTRNNLQNALDEIDRLDKEIQEVIDYFNTAR